MQYIRIKSWEKYQHYKDRNPPWIKLHRELITSTTWVTMDDASRVLAVAIMLLAAGTDNKIPANPAYLKRVAYLNTTPDFAPLVECEFIEIIDENETVLARASKVVAFARPETETETETETEQKKIKRVRAFNPPSVDEIKTYCQERRNTVNPERFHAHYESNGWMVGRNKMKNWKAAVHTWEQNSDKQEPQRKPKEFPRAR